MKTVFKDSNYLKIICINCQSIVNKLNSIEVLIYKENPDILCISESWCNNLNINTINLPTYNIASYYNRQNHIHGGVLILMRKEIWATPNVLHLV